MKIKKQGNILLANDTNRKKQSHFETLDYPFINNYKRIYSYEGNYVLMLAFIIPDLM